MVKFRTLNIGSHSGEVSGPMQAAHAKSSGSGRTFFTGTPLTGASAIELKKEVSDETKLALYERATQYLSSIFSRTRDNKVLDLDEGFGIMREIVDTQTPQDALFIKAIHSDESYRYVLHHSVNVAIYAVKLAESLGYNRDRQIEVGMAGLLHEVGMALIPEELIFKSDLSERDFHLFKERPTNGYNILRSIKGPYAYLAECALQVYERIDGSGYPKGLKGDEIHEYAQLIGLVDMYEALVHTRPQRDKFLHYNAVKEIINTGKKSFQPRHIKALLKLFSVFPLLSYVKLNSNAIGKVITTYPDQPMRPKLQMVMDSQCNMILSERVLNLPENPLLYITDALSEDDLAAYAEGSYFRDRSLPGAPPPENGNGDLDDAENHPKTPTVASTKRFWKRFGSKALSYGAAAAAVLVLASFWLSGKNVDSSQGDVAPAAVVPTSANQAAPRIVGPSPAVAATDSTPAPADAPAAIAGGNQVHVDVQEAVINDNGAQQPLAEQTVGMASGAEAIAPGPAASARNDHSAAPDDVNRPAYPFSVLLGSYDDLQQARQVAALYEKKGLVSYWVKVDLGDEGVRYRVFGGFFAAAEEAKQVALAHRLSPLAVKATRYAVQVGAPFQGQGDDVAYDVLQSKGFAPYRVTAADNARVTYIGAFYTEKGARDLMAALDPLGLDSRVVER